MATPAQNASPAPVVSRTVTFCAGYTPLVAVHVGVDRAAAAHRDDHRRYLRADDAAGEIVAHNSSGLMSEKVADKEDARFLLVADKAVDRLEKVAPLGGNAHVSDHGIDGLMVLLGVAEHALYYLLVNVDLHDDTVGIAENLIALFVEHVAYRTEIGALGYGSPRYRPCCQTPQATCPSVPDTADIVGVHLVVAQLAYDLFALPAVSSTRLTKVGAQLDIGDVFRNVAADSAVNDLDLTGVAPGRDILILRKPL